MRSHLSLILKRATHQRPPTESLTTTNNNHVPLARATPLGAFDDE
jgi:hypothetical protein